MVSVIRVSTTGAYLRGEFPQLVSHHLFCHHDVVVDFAIVDLEFEAYKIGQNGS
jgi:hypothetical protein